MSRNTRTVASGKPLPRRLATMGDASMFPLWGQRISSRPAQLSSSSPVTAHHGSMPSASYPPTNPGKHAHWQEEVLCHGETRSIGSAPVSHRTMDPPPHLNTPRGAASIYPSNFPQHSAYSVSPSRTLSPHSPYNASHGQLSHEHETIRGHSSAAHTLPPHQPHQRLNHSPVQTSSRVGYADYMSGMDTGASHSARSTMTSPNTPYARSQGVNSNLLTIPPALPRVSQRSGSRPASGVAEEYHPYGWELSRSSRPYHSDRSR